jgi:hypothetical protein
MNSKCKAIFNIIILKFLIIHVVKDFVKNHNKNMNLSYKKRIKSVKIIVWKLKLRNSSPSNEEFKVKCIQIGYMMTWLHANGVSVVDALTK